MCDNVPYLFGISELNSLNLLSLSVLLVGSEAPADDVGGISPPGFVMLTVAQAPCCFSPCAPLSVSLSCGA